MQHVSAVVLEDMVFVSSCIEDLKIGVGVGLVSKVVSLGLEKKSC